MSIWTDAHELLQARTDRGWHFDAEDNVWCFGLGDAGRVVVSEREGALLLYEYEPDHDTLVETVEAFASMLADLEQRYRGLTSVQRSWATSETIPIELLESLQAELALQDQALDAG